MRTVMSDKTENSKVSR